MTRLCSVLLLITALAAGCATGGSVVDVSLSSPAPSPSPVSVNKEKENPYLKMIDPSLYTSFISGKAEPLPENIPVMVAEWGILDGYEVIGYVELSGDTTQERILISKKYAQAFGGEVVMPKGLSQKDKSRFTGPVNEGFLIWRKKGSYVKPVAASTPEPLPSMKKIEEPIAPDFGNTKTASVSPDYPVYGKLPRLTYNLLMDDKDDIKNQNFRGTSYALKVYKVPEDLGIKVDAEALMVMLATKNEQNKLFMVLPSEKSIWIEEMIKSVNVMEYVYKPLGVYKGRYPVVQFVDEMK